MGYSTFSVGLSRLYKELAFWVQHTFCWFQQVVFGNIAVSTSLAVVCFNSAVILYYICWLSGYSNKTAQTFSTLFY